MATQLPIDRILRLNAALEATSLSRSTLYRKIQACTYPPQIKIAPAAQAGGSPRSPHGSGIRCSAAPKIIPPPNPH